ncbi:hypothetical protein BEWA_008460 [Theileria equi strain WA]|uniref:Rad21/Rec8-like protein N-terminal domain-containing protein n=1 Tax=Theileria equi strain WA TaxID=1537102 RepID=L0B2J9_THEEQ|nr:hypothetical protein BEWA_008460 [Theileria equi strain WA]AFZ81436.1 hypothetical protein BEWA_008460 [Theileria equi strain WA]|eukprot:XP_004831102.1 hypothetical protein BEWA_008460 [Theileria equi strain WA]
MSDSRTPLSFRSMESTNSPIYSMRTNYSAGEISLLEGDSLVVPFKPKLLVANGLKSELFKPLMTALFKGNKLKKETILNTDLESLCIAILETARMEESPFRMVGYHIKGLCIILSHKLKFLSQDLTAYMKRISTMDKIKQPEKRTKYYESDDECVVVRKRKRKLKEKEQIPRLEDKYDEEVDIPIERIEMLQMMNLGIGMGIGTELAFYDAQEHTNMDRVQTELSPLVLEYFKEFSSITSMEDLYNSEFAVNEKSKNWLDFDDLRMLTSPFKLNAYSYTPTPVSTIVASSVERSEKSYELDWSIYNDPLNYANRSDSISYARTIDTWSEPTTLALPAAPSRMSIGDLTMIKSDHKYDRSVQMKKSIRKKGVRKMKFFALEPPKNNSSGITKDSPRRNTTMLEKGEIILREPAWKDTILRDVSQKGTTLKETINQAVESLYSKYIGGTEKGVAKEKSDIEKIVRRINQAEKRVEPQRTVQPMKNTTYMDNLSKSEEIGTVQVLDAYREHFRETQSDVVNFGSITRGYNKRTASLVFFRTLILANSSFVNLEQMGDIKIAPGVSCIFRLLVCELYEWPMVLVTMVTQGGILVMNGYKRWVLSNWINELNM